MVRFFRVHAAKIGWSIVIFFGATMFTGAFFFGGSLKDSKQNKPSESVFATLNGQEVNQRKYFEALSQGYQSIQQSGSSDPEMFEMVQYRSFLQALNYSLLLDDVTQRDMEISRQELKQSLQTVYKQLDIRGKKELKAMLKKNNVPYKDFLANHTSNLKVKKLIRGIQGSVQVTDQHVDYQFQQVNVSHILLKTYGQDEGVVKEKADRIREALSGTLNFEEAVSLYSEDEDTQAQGGDLGYIRIGSIVKPFEDVAFSLTQGEISQPFKTVFGYHIVLLNGRFDLDKPEEIDYEADKKRLTETYQRLALDSYITHLMDHADLQVIDPPLKAAYSKYSRDFDGAIGGYQRMISQNPSSAVPHYLLSKLYILLGRSSEAILELEKADIKGTLNPAQDLPMAHILLGNLYVERLYSDGLLPKRTLQKIKKQLKDIPPSSYGGSQETLSTIINTLSSMKKKATYLKESLVHYDKALELAQSDTQILNVLLQLFTELKDKMRQKKVTETLVQLAEEQRLAEEKALAEQVPTGDVVVPTNNALPDLDSPSTAL